MANGLNKALEGFALGTLSDASGRDFIGPAIAHQRDKDMFAFQQRESERLREERRKRENEERRASRRGLMSAFQSVGAIRPEDIVASGGLDEIADLDDSDFGVLLAQLSDNQMQRLKDEDLFAAVRGMSAARGKPVPEGEMSRTQALELKASMDMEMLMAEERKQQRSETNRAMDMQLRQGSRDIQGLFRNPQSVNQQTLVQAFARHQQLAAKVQSAAGELDEDQYEMAMGELNHLADTIRQYQDDVGLNTIAAQPPQKIVAAITSLEPHQRAAALERPRIAAAWDRVSATAQALVGMGEEGAARVDAAHGTNFAMLREAVISGDIENDSALAGRLFEAAGKVAEGPRLLKEADAVEAGRARAAAAANTVKASGFASEVDPLNFVDERGTFNEDGYQRAVYTDVVQEMDGLEPSAALDLLNRLGNAPSDLQRLAAKQAQRSMDRQVAATRPSALSPVELLSSEVSAQEDVAYEALDLALTNAFPEIEERPAKWEGPWWNQKLVDSGSKFERAKLQVDSEHLGALRQAVAQTAAPLEGQMAALQGWASTVQQERASADPELRSMYDESLEEMREVGTALDYRFKARSAAFSMLKNAAPAFSKIEASTGGTPLTVGQGILRAFGKGDEEALEEAAGVTTVEGILGALQAGLVEKLKADGITGKPAAEAVAAEMDRLYELYNKLDKHLEDPTALKHYRRTGVIRGQAADVPALEFLAYLL